MAKLKIDGGAGMLKYPEGDQHLLESEIEVMDAVWDSPDPLTTNDIHAEVSIRRRSAGKPIASFTTIDAIVRRLIRRGVIDGEKRGPRTVVIIPRLTRGQYVAYAMNYVSQSVLKKNLLAVLPRLSGADASGKHKANGSNSVDTDVQQLLETIADLSKG